MTLETSQAWGLHVFLTLVVVMVVWVAIAYWRDTPTPDPHKNPDNFGRH